MAINNEDVTDFKAQRNKNALIIGGSGVENPLFRKPNIMQLNADFVAHLLQVTHFKRTGGSFRAKENYDIRALNLIYFSKSMHYNPLAYLKKKRIF